MAIGKPPSVGAGNNVVHLPGSEPVSPDQPFKRLIDDMNQRIGLARLEAGRSRGIGRPTVYDSIDDTGRNWIRATLGDAPRGSPSIDGARIFVGRK